jgi:O-acetyl-ADP-ribose deacetylase (regulator of RNase III)
MIIEKTGNIFTTKAQTIVNTVNCVGVMGAGIAYEFRLRYPDMYTKYQIYCHENKINIGTLWIYKNKNKNILNFPTKYDWKYPSKEEYLKQGLQKFVTTYKQKGITSIAFPLLGADKGGIDKNKSIYIMKSYLSKCDIDIEIWHFDPAAQDDLYINFKNKFEDLDDKTIKDESLLNLNMIKKIKQSLTRTDINSLSGLLRVRGIGDKTLEKAFNYILKEQKTTPNLFNYQN